MKILLVVLAVFSQNAFAGKPKKPVLTKQEQAIVAAAKKTFKAAEKLPPPSKNMQDKMQSSVKQ